MKKLLLFIFTVLPLVLFAQGEAANWYFGQNAGLSFSSGTPIVLTNSQLVTEEGCATISDENGNLLDSTYERDQLFGFTLGSESVNTALQKGVIGMKVKQKKKIQVLVEQVHLSPSPNWLHPKNILTYEVKLMKIRSR